MSWLEELEYTHVYLCPGGHVFERVAKEKPGDTLTCPENGCGQEAAYKGFRPMKIGGHARIQKEKNGRIYYETNDGKGKVSRISKTKYDYLESGDTRSKITEEYKRHVQDKQMTDFNKFRYNNALKKESKASVTGASKENVSEN